MGRTLLLGGKDVKFLFSSGFFGVVLETTPRGVLHPVKPDMAEALLFDLANCVAGFEVLPLCRQQGWGLLPFISSYHQLGHFVAEVPDGVRVADLCREVQKIIFRLPIYDRQVDWAVFDPCFDHFGVALEYLV